MTQTPFRYSSQADLATPPDHHAAPQRSPDPLRVATGVYVVVHGHFYQPPRENPYLEVIERQPSAAPFHNWNERIHHECYRPNAFARVLNDRGEVVDIVNNYEFISFNIGATLLNWLERYDLETYQRILEADRLSCQRLQGHGNAIAQAYNHIILPLANPQDKITQIRWGKADFRSRFGRDPEGMWLAETAVDTPTLAALIAEEIRFIILAPSQAAQCRPFDSEFGPTGDWDDVRDSSIDPTRPYRCWLPGGDRDRDYIDIFFYDGPISADMGFSEVMHSSQLFAERIGQAIRTDQRSSQVISVATDGETFGHHKAGAEKALTYALIGEFPNWGWTVTNYAHYLSLSPPTWEVQLKPVTAWSCAHGVDRWQEDCGCGGGGSWQQQWRKPLRETLNWLRDELIQVFETAGSRLFKDPWAARNAYIDLLRDRQEGTISRWLTQHQSHELRAAERVDALRLLEMQRHTLFMFTSCGWFFDEISRPEGTQILRYASRAIELAGLVAGVQLETAFIQRLATAPSNVESFGDGAEIYRQLVISAQVSLEQIAAHYAISSLFNTYDRDQQLYCYTIRQLDDRRQRMGALTLAVGRIELRSDLTHATTDLVFAMLHLGGWDFHCCIQPFKSRLAYAQLQDRLFAVLQQASAAQSILVMSECFGEQFYNLQSLFGEERHHIMRLLSQATLMRLDQLYTQVYRDNYSVLSAFYREDLEVPQELQVAAEIALSHRATYAMRSLEQEISDSTRNPLQQGTQHLLELETIALEATHCHCQLKIPGGQDVLERLILQSLWHLLHDPQPSSLEPDTAWIQRLIRLGDRLHLNLSLARAQELYLDHIKNRATLTAAIAPAQGLNHLLTLGVALAVDVPYWLARQETHQDR